MEQLEFIDYILAAWRTHCPLQKQKPNLNCAETRRLEEYLAPGANLMRSIISV